MEIKMRIGESLKRMSDDAILQRTRLHVLQEAVSRN